MVKGKAYKITSIIFILVFIISITGPVYADKELVADQAGLFTADEAARLRQGARTLGEKYMIDIVIVTTSDTGDKSSREYGDDYFDYNGYGIGENKDGILFLMDFDNREMYISTSGSGIKYLTDERIESILDDVFSNGLTSGDNFGAANAFLESTGSYLAEGIPENQYSVPEPPADKSVVDEAVEGSANTDKELVADQAGLFTADEVARLRQGAKVLGEKYMMDIVIVTTSDAEGKNSMEYADDYFDYNGFGVGRDRDGILFLLDFDNNNVYISTSGSGIRYLTDERYEKVMDDVFSRGLTSGDNFGAANAFLEATGSYLAEGIPKVQNSVPEPVANSLSIAEAIVGAVIGGLTGMIFHSVTRSSYKGSPKPNVFEYRKNSIVNLGIIDDSLVNTYVTTRVIPKAPPPSQSSSVRNTSGKSTIHKSSSGMSHGGGGRSITGGSTTHRSSSGRSHGGGGRKF